MGRSTSKGDPDADILAELSAAHVVHTSLSQCKWEGAMVMVKLYYALRIP